MIEKKKNSAPKIGNGGGSATITTPGYKGGSTAPKPVTTKPKVSKTTGPKVAPRTGAKVTKPISGSNRGTVTTPGFKPKPKKPEFR